ncbi:MAG: LysR family transcriptional regulator [Microcoleus sp. PH2017_15_JOR_U_A]|jgi:DNA-binding transcriptional LysR family regulator|uniref:LysR family transcriptional regulator n=1 Tax=unclassified Microcoleus TaxID=2642155 RepID=UPI001D768BA8|nr:MULTISPECIES: LysR family transcriptional regulator [unclassified Microcoleus]TAG00933.1 MAG: LysR family transcriptional regulator [Oscillatoriales cyanobacterium]MCC3434343.1 LysR family transcriptional regulator [Microcoleus sp. PH2017_05_CCC_O_A]MCC3499748.1 LysR family transcriptional regulator [Microcoleus sp. PH2017_15_JOR_U_A]MCC3593324.1 LysR family transcriptional regulator [Microcoleus sp. PH2017_28_MFU_U_A]TAG16673.1 MAG: LysR family transcriptional regulator [Oscillatoriales cy
MELRHLRYFIAVAEELNFTRAAERLHMAQPPLSQQIQHLEAELGFQLFRRTKRTVVLTEAGQVFFEEAQKILLQVDRAIQLGKQTSRGELGQLTVGFVSSAAHNVVPAILQAFRTRCPAVKLELHELTTNEQLQRLRFGRIDIGFVRPPIEEDGINSEIVFREPLIVALPETHYLADRAVVELRELSAEPFILFPRSLAPGLYDPIVSLCLQAGFSPIAGQEAIQMQTIISLVAAEMGVAIVPASMQNFQRTGVVYKHLQEPSPIVSIALIWRDNPTPAVQRFLQTARDLSSLQY